jgi:hypothetical protein
VNAGRGSADGLVLVLSGGEGLRAPDTVAPTPERALPILAGAGERAWCLGEKAGTYTRIT